MKRTREQQLRKALEEQKCTNVMLQQELFKVAHDLLTLRGELAAEKRAHDKVRLERDELRATSVRPHCPQGNTAALLAEENAALRALVRLILKEKP